MSRTLKTPLKLSTAALPLLLAAGCATNGAQGYTQSEIAQIQETAQQALETAQAAQGKAQAAMDAAATAQQMALEAQNTADAALSTAKQSSEKLDRMFKQTMYK